MKITHKALHGTSNNPLDPLCRNCLDTHKDINTHKSIEDLQERLEKV